MVSFFITTVLWQMRGISEKNDSDGPRFLVLYLQDRTKLYLRLGFVQSILASIKSFYEIQYILFYTSVSKKKSQKTSTFHLKKQANQIKVKFHRHCTDKNTILYLFKSLHSIITVHLTLFEGILNVCVIYRIWKKINIPVYHEVATPHQGLGSLLGGWFVLFLCCT